MRFYNTLHRVVEEFVPTDQPVKLYTCGPTVYDSAHIGNLRTYIFEDILKRTLKFFSISVDHVMNITDVDDKTIKKSGGEKAEFDQLTRKCEEDFFSDLKKLNIEFPNKVTRATEYVDQIVDFISDLIDKGYAYKGEDGSIYFSISKFKDYGKLSGLNLEDLKVGARVKQDEYTKDNPADFVLWKSWDEADGEIFWETKLGKGRPGWHIECSAMSQGELGETIDIHAGAVDLIFPHHENEIAQSEARTGKTFSRFWLHGEHLLVDGRKMSKSLNNFYTLSDIEKKGFSSLDFRYLCLQSHYRSKLNFTWQALEGARNARLRLINLISNIKFDDSKTESKNVYLKKFKEKLADDLNMPEALAIVWELIRDENVADEEKFSIIGEIDRKVLGLGLDKPESEKIPDEIIDLKNRREKLRLEKKFTEADGIREQIEKLGYEVEDKESGSEIRKK